MTRKGMGRAGSAFWTVAAAVGVLAAGARAEDNTSLEVNGITSSQADYVLGNTGTNNSLIATSGGILDNTGPGVAGNQAGADHNRALITGAGSAWTNSGSLIVGRTGDVNRIEVRNGGLLASPHGLLGEAPGSDGNQVVLAGPDSSWQAEFDLWIGSWGANNSLMVTGGASAGVGGSTTVGEQDGATGNLMLVTSGSTWTNTGDLISGWMGSGNAIRIEDNSQVEVSGSAYLGAGSTASDNRLEVRGPGSMLFSWLATVGQDGDRNILSVEDGASLVCVGALSVGLGIQSEGNEVRILGTGSVCQVLGDVIVGQAGPQSRLTVGSGAGLGAANLVVGQAASSTGNMVTILADAMAQVVSAVEVRRGTLILAGGELDGENLVLTNTEGRLVFEGGNMRSFQTLVDNGLPFVVGDGIQAATNEVTGPAAPGHVYIGGLVVNTNAALAGTGTVHSAATLLAGAGLAPGASVGVLSVSNLTLAGAAFYHAEADSNGTDRVEVGGALVFAPGSTVTVHLADAGGAVFGSSNALFRYGTLAGLPTRWILDPGATGAAGLGIRHDAAGRQFVLATNRPPVFTSSPVTSAVVGEAYRYTIAAEDPDGDPVRLTTPILPAWLTLTNLPGGTNLLVGTPTEAEAAAVTVVADDANTNAVQSFTIQVRGRTGALAIGVTPDTGAWRLANYPAAYAGITSGSGDHDFGQVPTGVYAVAFDPIPGYLPPAGQTQDLAFGASVTFEGAYRRLAVAGDYNGDGQTDLVLYDAANGRWFALAPDGTTVMWAEAWGGPGCTPVPGDYNGDGVMDLAVYQQATGLWYIRTLAGEILAWGVAWGGLGYEPVPGDFNADGVWDLAVYAEAAGVWHVSSLDGSFAVPNIAWGAVGLEAVPGDYDGDRASDLAIYGRAGGAWYVETVQARVLAWAETWGGAAMVPVSGDYNGDGVSDLAVYHTSSGAWFIRTMPRIGAEPEVLAWALGWGWSGAWPVSGDYDGDGYYDLAVYSASLGRWFVYSFHTGQAIVWNQAWGGPGLWPVVW